MSIAWSEFTPLNASLGGALIGFAAVVLLCGLGRLAGVSSILSTVVLAPLTGGGTFLVGQGWRIAFLFGLFAAPWFYQLFATLPQTTNDSSRLTLIVAGLLVGFGSRLGSGCTSGHGVCGLSRLSIRSLVATLTFMASGFFVVWMIRHVF